jgi:hypothetical protein
MKDKGLNVTFIELPNYRTSSVHAGKILAELNKLAVGPETTLVAHIFDSGLYMAAPGEGGLIPHCRRIDGSYHMDEDLVLLPKDLQYDLLKQMASELDNYKKNPVIFVAPLPRYMEEGCCGDKDHMKNRREPDFAQRLEKGVFEVRTNIKNSAFRHGF